MLFQANVPGGNVGIRPSQAQYSDHNIELARKQNLAKIQQLRQTLEAAQAQELQYKSQMEVRYDKKTINYSKMHHKH